MPVLSNQLIYIGIRGTVLAIDRKSGKEVWRRDLKGSDFVNVFFDSGDLFASARGEMYCLDPVSGKIRWNNPLKGLGWGLISMASTTAANSNSVAMAEFHRQQAAAASAAAGASASS